MKTPTVHCYLGHQIDDPTEKHVLARLQRDLERRGVGGTILANFVAGKHARQVDLLIITPVRVVQCELKGYRVPIVAKANGPWKQNLPDGQLRDLDGNGFRQAQDATYALSDDLRDFAARDPSVPSVRGVKFYKQIDTVVCLYPTIQPGSRVEKYPYVSLLGYDQLLDRLVLPGPCLPWSDGVWDAFVRHLGLYRPNERSADDRERDAERAIVEDYRRRFVSAHAAELHELVPVAAVVDGRRVSQPDIAALAAAQQAVLVLGPSGIGKTHLAEHAALDLARQDHVTL